MDVTDLFPDDRAIVSRGELMERIGVSGAMATYYGDKARLQRLGAGYFARLGADRLQVIAELHRAQDLRLLQLGWMTAAHLHGVVPELPQPLEVAIPASGWILPDARARYLYGRVRPDLTRRPATVLPTSCGLPVTTVEATLVDLLVDYTVPEIEDTVLALAGLGPDLAEVTRLLGVHRRADTLARRLGFVLERAGRDAESLRDVLQPRDSDTPVLLDPRGWRGGSTDERWCVRVNT